MSLVVPTVRAARWAALVLLVLILVGTLMPGTWRDTAARPFDTVLDAGAAAHVLLFAGLAYVLPFARLWRARPWHVPALGLALALLTEGLQHVVPGRHPGLDGVLQDLIGTLLGWTAARAVPSTAPSRTR